MRAFDKKEALLRLFEKWAEERVDHKEIMRIAETVGFFKDFEWWKGFREVES